MPELPGVDECRSCSACWHVCPVGAIDAIEHRGFHYPRVDQAKCVGCGRCEHACEVKLASMHVVYGVKNANAEERRMATSGGVYLLLADWVLSEGGVVYGARDDRGHTLMARAATREDALAFCGSKYVWCPTGETYPRVKEDLEDGLAVLYTGTSCQINGLNRYLEIERADSSRLVTVDFLCHGTPSPDVYRSYLDFVESASGRRIARYQMRRTHGCWNRSGEAYRPIIHYEDGRTDGKSVLSQLWIRAFFGNRCLKEGCYRCKFASSESPADLTMGDLWGLDAIDASFSDGDGVSLLKVNTARGKEAFGRVRAHAEVIEVPEDRALARQVNAFRPTAAPDDKDAFWRDYHELPFKALMAKYCQYTPWLRLKYRVKRLLVERGRLRR